MRALCNGTLGMALVLTLLAPFVVPTSQAEEIRIAENAGQAGLHVRAQDATGIELSYAMESFAVDAVEIRGEELQKISLPGCILPNDAGAPDLPGFGRYIAVPMGGRAVVTITAAETRTLTGLDVLPAAPIPFENDDSPLVHEKDPAIYGARANYPAEPVMVSEPFGMRGVQAVTLGITPFQYNPVTQELTVYTKLDIRVDFVGGTGQFAEERLRSRFWEPMLRDQLLNYEMLPAVDFNSTLQRDNRYGYEYVIITADEANCIQWANALKDWRQAQGISTEVFTTTETGSSYTQIDSWLDNAYETWEVPPVAFLILGDYPGTGDDVLPGVTAPIYGGYCASDNVYADTNNNNLPEMAHGRICARTDEELAIIVQKQLDFEQNPYTDPYYYQHPLIAGGWQTERWFILCTEVCLGHQANVLGKDPVREYAIYSGYPGSTWSTAPNTYAVVSYFGPSGLGYIPSTPSHLTDWGGNYIGIDEAIENGCYFVLHRDHGLVSGWGEPQYGTGHLGLLENDMLTYVFTINCLTGQYNYPGTSFTERFHRIPLGAVGLIAASEVSYSFVNDAYVWGMFDSMWPEFDPGYGDAGDETGAANLRPGFANTYGKYYLQASSWPYNTNSKHVTYALFHHHGDAFLTLNDRVPTALTVVHDDHLELEATTFSVQADAGALIGLTVDGELIGSALGTGAPLNIPITPQTVEGTLRVVVTQANKLPYDATVPIQDFSAVDPTMPNVTRLGAAHPNPFTNTTQIGFNVPASAVGQPLRLDVVDPSGRLVRTLVDRPQAAGAQTVVWDGTDATGERVPSGVYYYQMSMDGENATKRMILLR